MTGVETMTMPKAEAHEAYREYRDAFRVSRQMQDKALAQGYKAIAAGRCVLDVHAAFRATGLDEQGFPKLALCRAHETHCTVALRRDGSASFYGGTSSWLRERSRRIEQIPAGTFTGARDFKKATALVPLIPPRFRPVHKLAGYHLLWEAEWGKAAPVDPMLLKHLGGALYAVLAQWDLTPLERAVLAGRL